MRGWIGLVVFLLWAAIPASACNCIASESNPHVVRAYLVITGILVFLPLISLSWIARKVARWDIPEAVA
jgi:hypothetical protein